MARKPGPTSAKGSSKGASKASSKGISKAPTKPAPKRVSKSTTPSAETLGALTADTLIRLILDEVGGNPAFKKRVSAAIAGTRGPEAVAAIVDRRLAALEKARGFIDWEKLRAFAADLSASLAVIVGELKPLDPDMALQRLHRFLVGSDGVLERVDDSSGRIYAVYENAAEEAAILSESLSPAQADTFAQALVPALDRDGFGLVEHVFVGLLPKLSPEALAQLDARFVEGLAGLPKPAPPPKAGVYHPYDEAESRGRLRRRVFDRLRKALADARGDVEAFMALEQSDPARRPDCVAIADRLLAAERPDEALDWVRKDETPRYRTAPARLEDDAFDLIAPDRRRHDVEIRILEALGRNDEAQGLRWARFERVLDPQALRDHLARLPDFEDEEVLERALAHAGTFENRLAGLDFLVRWPRLDLAARLVIAHPKEWDGRHWQWLAPAAEGLAEDHPLAASLLYRALLDDILGRARSPAYGHGARHLATLDALAERLAPGSLDPDHAAYRAALRKAHGRKIGFWSRVKG